MQNTLTIPVANLSGQHERVASYYGDADAIEYLRRPAPRFYRRIDEFLTLAHDMDSRELMGFRLKGFRNFYLKHLAPTYNLIDPDFVMLVSVVEKVVEVVAEDFIDDIKADARRQAAYADVHRMALDDRVELRDLPPLAA